MTFAYARARMQARHGERPDEIVWNRLHASSSLAHFLEAARGTGLRRWVSHLTVRTPPHDVELTLRADFTQYVGEVATWVPDAWRAAVLWVAGLVRVPLADLEDWRALWPRTTHSERAHLVLFTRTLERHLDAMAHADSASDGFAERARLELEFARLFRWHAEEPVAPFCHLGLVALDLERLRGAVLRRALFPDVRSEVAWV